MSKSRGILPPRQFWSEPEVELLRALYADTLTTDLAELLNRTVHQVLSKANALGLRKSLALIARVARERIEENPIHGSRLTRIQPGNVPFNKGLKRGRGWAPGRMAEGQFKAGRAPHEAPNYQPIGSTRITRDGALERKVTDDPSLYPARRWVAVARLVWVDVNGAIPAGHLIRFKAGMHTTVADEITVDRLECVSRAEHARRNIEKFPIEIRRLTQLRGAITRQINKRAKDER